MTKSTIKLSIDNEVAADFRESFEDNYETIANHIIKFDNNSADSNAVDAIFGALHTIKGNASMCQLEELAIFVHAIEEVISAMRNSKLTYSPIYGEMILLCLDKLKEVSEDQFVDENIDSDLLTEIVNTLKALSAADTSDGRSHADKVIALITGYDVSTNKRLLENTGNGIVNEQIRQPTEHEPKKLEPADSQDLPESLNESLAYFKQLVSLLDLKLPYWKDRTARTLPLALAINHALSAPVLEYQLEAAVYMHDVAFAFLNESLLLKSGKFDTEDKNIIHTHPAISANFVKLVPGWQKAALIIEQHHEHWDGSGYPLGIAQDSICLGAQVLAIVDAYESMTNPRPDRQYKRTVLRAVTEINNCSGTQFSPDVTAAFNKMIRKFITR